MKIKTYNTGNHRLIKTLFICFFSIFIINKLAAMEVRMSDIGNPSSDWCYYDSTAFVNFPAYIGYNVMFSVGTLTLMSCFSDKGILLAHEYFGYSGYLVFGAPFYLLEATFYDLPLYLWDSMFGSDDEEEIVKDVVDSNNESPPTLKDSTNSQP